jgi:hypothetical protein
MHRGLLGRVLVAPAVVAMLVGLDVDDRLDSSDHGRELWLVGDTLGPAPDYVESPLIQHRDGAGWATLDSRCGEPWGVAALSATDAWIVGNQENPRGNYSGMIEHWNGTAWALLPTMNSSAGDSELNGIAALPNGMLWAVGSYSPHGTDQPLIEFNPSG